MIQSILDNDLYKFTMQQAVLQLYPHALARYAFFNRSQTPFPPGFARRVKSNIEKMAGLGLTPQERDYLEQACPYLTPVYLDFLTAFRFEPGQVALDQDGTVLCLDIQGPWYKTILWEIPVMAIISEVYFQMTAPRVHTRDKIQKTNQAKAALMAGCGALFADFGTRRRFSAANHQMLIQDILDVRDHSFMGTSNVHLARIFNLMPVGTMAHEWMMFHAALGGYAMANTLALDAWVRVFQGQLGIALTDTYTTDLFLKDFNGTRARVFDGVRQDSGDPLAFTRQMIRHYRDLGIDPATKTIVFSNGLDPERAADIQAFCRGKIRPAFGIGTNLTNDVGATPLNMVIKMTACRPVPEKRWLPTVKLSDDPGKRTGDPDELRRCLGMLGINGE